jgi:hypothetical protein
MRVIRRQGDFELNQCLHNNLFNVSDSAKDVSSIGTAKMKVSFWFDSETKGKLLNLSKLEFKKECKLLLADSEY